MKSGEAAYVAQLRAAIKRVPWWLNAWGAVHVGWTGKPPMTDLAWIHIPLRYSSIIAAAGAARAFVAVLGTTIQAGLLTLLFGIVLCTLPVSAPILALVWRRKAKTLTEVNAE